MTERSALHTHLDAAAFVEAVRFTSARTGFSPRLVEKDYYCSLVLERLEGTDALVFKGGTCLAKVHAGFYRLSEDLDFTIPVTVNATRGRRRARVAPVKAIFADIQDRQPALRVLEPLRGANNSTQYLATLAYTSLLTRQDETIKIEIALREPLLIEPVKAGAATLLLEPIAERSLAEKIPTTCIAFAEAFAEKFRAALTRREPAIRDFFDIDWAVRGGRLALGRPSLVSLVRGKLKVRGNAPVNMSPQRLAALRRQLDPDLRPVLRPADFAAFDLDRAFTIVSEMAAKVGTAR